MVPIHRQKTLIGFKKAQSHLAKIIHMVEANAYCIDIIHQSLAVQKVLKVLDTLIMEDHIKNCVAEQAKDGDFQKITDELISIYTYK